MMTTEMMTEMMTTEMMTTTSRQAPRPDALQTG